MLPKIYSFASAAVAVHETETEPPRKIIRMTHSTPPEKAIIVSGDVVNKHGSNFVLNTLCAFFGL